MRKKLIGFIILLIALSFLTLGIIEGQFALLNGFYEEMASVE
ncbi:MAG: hypothetical protein ACFFAN_02000 [Promethearchaeota archaeon]